MRTLNLAPGTVSELPISDGKKSVSARIEVQGREEIKTPSGVYKTVRCEAFLFNDVLYRRPAQLYVWLTDDDLKIPVLVIVGEHDTPYILAAADYMVERIPSAQKAIVKDAAHLPNMDHPEEFRGLVENFLEELSG